MTRRKSDWDAISKAWRANRFLRIPLALVSAALFATTLAIPVLQLFAPQTHCTVDTTTVAPGPEDSPPSQTTKVEDCERSEVPVVGTVLLAVLAAVLLVPEVLAAAPWLELKTPWGSIGVPRLDDEAEELDAVNDGFQQDVQALELSVDNQESEIVRVEGELGIETARDPEKR